MEGSEKNHAEQPLYDAKYLEEVTKRIFGESGKFKVSASPDVGRFVITTESLRAGEVIMESEPYSLVVNEEYIPFVCHNCFMTKLMHDADDKEVQPFSCSACDSAYYCSEQCKDEHWAQVHHLECPLLPHARRAPLDISATSKLRVLIRLLASRKREREGYVPSGPVFEDVAGLISHPDDIKADENRKVVEYAKGLLPPDWFGSDTVEQLVDLLSKSECNQFGLWTPRDDLLGVSIHPAASFFNHSCLPNCYVEWYGPRLVFKALYPIPANSELNISYIAANMDRARRQFELKRLYMFDCKCLRCEEELADEQQGKTTRGKYNTFFYKYLQCPKCTGLMRLDVTSTLNLRADSENPASMLLEDRSCMTCGFERPGTERIPSLKEWSYMFSGVSTNESNSDKSPDCNIKH